MSGGLPITPALLAAYPTLPMPPFRPSKEDILIMHPVLVSTICVLFLGSYQDKPPPVFLLPNISLPMLRQLSIVPIRFVLATSSSTSGWVLNSAV
jgi:hypothetical protein